MKKRSIILIFLLIIFSFNFAFASISVGNNSVKSLKYQYSPSQNLEGSINISLDEESGRTILKDNKGNSIKLLEWLNATQSDYFFCNTIDCSSDFEISNEQLTKTFSVSAGEEKIVGIFIEEDISDISSVEFSVNSNAEESCERQYEIDFLSDGIIDFQNNKAGSLCPSKKTYGCFKSFSNSETAIMGTYPYCQRMNLSISPKFAIGAWLKGGSSSINLTASIKTTWGEEVQNGSCKLSSPPSEGGEVSCEVNFSLQEPEEYYVCIFPTGTGIRPEIRYSTSTKCGFNTANGFENSEIASYQIFATGKGFGSPGLVRVNNLLSDGNNLNSLSNDFLLEKYGTTNCEEGCVIPIKIKSNVGQEISLSSLQFKYNVVGAGEKVEANFGDITEKTPKISTEGYRLFSLEYANFSMPSSYGSFEYTLSLGNKKLFTEDLSIEKIPTINSVSPIVTSSALPTLFKANSTSFNSTISSYEWNFGDGTTRTTTSSQIEHTYNTTGTYLLIVTIKDSLSRESSRAFNIYVGSPQEIINKTLFYMQKNLTAIKSQINSLSQFEKTQLSSALSLENLESTLIKNQQLYSSADSLSDYNSIMTNLLSAKFPLGLEIKTIANNLLFVPSEDSINLDAIKEIAGGAYESSKSSSYKKGVISSGTQNIILKVTQKNYQVLFDEGEQNVLMLITITPEIKDSSATNYLFVKELSGLTFKENYLEKPSSGYKGIEIKPSQNSVIFSSTEVVDFTNLPIFVSPSLARITIEQEIASEVPEKPFNWSSFLLIVGIVIVLGAGAFFGIRYWYIKNYEDHLFENKNNLLNILTYISNEKKKNVSDSDISSKLHKAGWSYEQIQYALKKYSSSHIQKSTTPANFLQPPISKNINPFPGRNFRPKGNI